LDKGQISFIGDTKSAISHYLNKGPAKSSGGLPAEVRRSGNGKVILERIWVTDATGREQGVVISGQTVVFHFSVRKNAINEVRNVSVGIGLHNYLDDIFSILYSDYCGFLFTINSHKSTISCSIENFPFSAGRYLLHARIVADGEEADWPLDYVMALNVEDGSFYNTATRFHGGIGPVLLSGRWSLNPEQSALCDAECLLGGAPS
jgi:hypothetical protein